MMNHLAFRPIGFKSPEFEKECCLRDIVLRQPLGLSLFDEDLEAERDQMHFGLFDRSSELIACVIAIPQSSGTAKIRQMAVLPVHANKGHGSAILKSVEDYLFERGFRHLFLHARSEAVTFYKKQGYVEIGPQFIEVGIPHVRMEKRL